MKIKIGIFLAFIILLLLPQTAYCSDGQIFKPYINYKTGSYPEAVAIGDVNGDGKNDVVMTTSYNFDPEKELVYQQIRGEGKKLYDDILKANNYQIVISQQQVKDIAVNFQ